MADSRLLALRRCLGNPGIFSRTKISKLVNLHSSLKCSSNTSIKALMSTSTLWDAYNSAKLKCKAFQNRIVGNPDFVSANEPYLITVHPEEPLVASVSPNSVFACNGLDLAQFEVYGFDYDYTLACYKESLHSLLYDLGKEFLVNKLKYPKPVADLPYLPGFAVRGLHYDIHKGLLLKLDSYRQIQLGTVYRGHKPLTDEEVLDAYGHLYIPIEYMEGTIRGDKSAKMQHLNDLFSLPEMGLVSNVTEYFESHNIPYHPEILFWDVRNAVQSIHPVMHHILEKNVEIYLNKDPNLRTFLERLIKGKKRLFLITNSPYSFVNEGMKFLIGNDWTEMFDVVVVQARKPKFFSGHSRPFRIYNPHLETQMWERVTQLEKGHIYLEGTLSQLQAMTGWMGEKVLYFGDHVYSDLADLTLHYGWGTGAIISELAREISTLNNEKFKRTVSWLQTLQELIEEMQDHEDAESQAVLRQWEAERDDLRNNLKSRTENKRGIQPD